MLKSKNNHSVSSVGYKQSNQFITRNTRVYGVELSHSIVEQLEPALDPANANPSLFDSTGITETTGFTSQSNTNSKCGAVLQQYSFLESRNTARQYFNEQGKVTPTPTAEQVSHPTLIAHAIRNLDTSIHVQDQYTSQVVDAEQGKNLGQDARKYQLANACQVISTAFPTQATQEQGTANSLYCTLYRSNPSDTQYAVKTPNMFREIDARPIPYTVQHLNKQLVPAFGNIDKAAVSQNSMTVQSTVALTPKSLSPASQSQVLRTAAYAPQFQALKHTAPAPQSQLLRTVVQDPVAQSSIIQSWLYDNTVHNLVTHSGAHSTAAVQVVSSKPQVLSTTTQLQAKVTDKRFPIFKSQVSITSKQYAAAFNRTTCQCSDFLQNSNIVQVQDTKAPSSLLPNYSVAALRKSAATSPLSLSTAVNSHTHSTAAQFPAAYPITLSNQVKSSVLSVLSKKSQSNLKTSSNKSQYTYAQLQDLKNNHINGYTISDRKTNLLNKVIPSLQFDNRQQSLVSSFSINKDQSNFQVDSSSKFMSLSNKAQSNFQARDTVSQKSITQYLPQPPQHLSLFTPSPKSQYQPQLQLQYQAQPHYQCQPKYQVQPQLVSYSKALNINDDSVGSLSQIQIPNKPTQSLQGNIRADLSVITSVSPNPSDVIKTSFLRVIDTTSQTLKNKFLYPTDRGIGVNRSISVDKAIGAGSALGVDRVIGADRTLGIDRAIGVGRSLGADISINRKQPYGFSKAAGSLQEQNVPPSADTVPIPYTDNQLSHCANKQPILYSDSGSVLRNTRNSLSSMTWSNFFESAEVIESIEAHEASSESGLFEQLHNITLQVFLLLSAIHTEHTPQKAQDLLCKLQTIKLRKQELLNFITSKPRKIECIKQTLELRQVEQTKQDKPAIRAWPVDNVRQARNVKQAAQNIKARQDREASISKLIKHTGMQIPLHATPMLVPYLYHKSVAVMSCVRPNAVYPDYSAQHEITCSALPSHDSNTARSTLALPSHDFDTACFALPLISHEPVITGNILNSSSSTLRSQESLSVFASNLRTRTLIQKATPNMKVVATLPLQTLHSQQGFFTQALTQSPQLEETHHLTPAEFVRNYSKAEDRGLFSVDCSWPALKPLSTMHQTNCMVHQANLASNTDSHHSALHVVNSQLSPQARDSVNNAGSQTGFAANNASQQAEYSINNASPQSYSAIQYPISYKDSNASHYSSKYPFNHVATCSALLPVNYKITPHHSHTSNLSQSLFANQSAAVRNSVSVNVSLNNGKTHYDQGRHSYSYTSHALWRPPLVNQYVSRYLHPQQDIKQYDSQYVHCHRYQHSNQQLSEQSTRAPIKALISHLPITPVVCKREYRVGDEGKSLIKTQFGSKSSQIRNSAGINTSQIIDSVSSNPSQIRNSIVCNSPQIRDLVVSTSDSDCKFQAANSMVNRAITAQNKIGNQTQVIGSLGQCSYSVRPDVHFLGKESYRVEQGLSLAEQTLHQADKDDSSALGGSALNGYLKAFLPACSKNDGLNVNHYASQTHRIHSHRNQAYLNQSRLGLSYGNINNGSWCDAEDKSSNTTIEDKSGKTTLEDKSSKPVAENKSSKTATEDKRSKIDTEGNVVSDNIQIYLAKLYQPANFDVALQHLLSTKLPLASISVTFDLVVKQLQIEESRLPHSFQQVVKPTDVQPKNSVNDIVPKENVQADVKDIMRHTTSSGMVLQTQSPCLCSTKLDPCALKYYRGESQTVSQTTTIPTTPINYARLLSTLAQDPNFFDEQDFSLENSKLDFGVMNFEYLSRDKQPFVNVSGYTERIANDEAISTNRIIYGDAISDVTNNVTNNVALNTSGWKRIYYAASLQSRTHFELMNSVNAGVRSNVNNALKPINPRSSDVIDDADSNCSVEAIKTALTAQAPLFWKGTESSQNLSGRSLTLLSRNNLSTSNTKSSLNSSFKISCHSVLTHKPFYVIYPAGFWGNAIWRNLSKLLFVDVVLKGSELWNDLNLLSSSEYLTNFSELTHCSSGFGEWARRLWHGSHNLKVRNWSLQGFHQLRTQHIESHSCVKTMFQQVAPSFNLMLHSLYSSNVEFNPLVSVKHSKSLSNSLGAIPSISLKHLDSNHANLESKSSNLEPKSSNLESKSSNLDPIPANLESKSFNLAPSCLMPDKHLAQGNVASKFMLNLSRGALADSEGKNSNLPCLKENQPPLLFENLSAACREVKNKIVTNSWLKNQEGVYKNLNQKTAVNTDNSKVSVNSNGSKASGNTYSYSAVVNQALNNVAAHTITYAVSHPSKQADFKDASLINTGYNTAAYEHSTVAFNYNFSACEQNTALSEHNFSSVEHNTAAFIHNTAASKRNVLATESNASDTHDANQVSLNNKKTAKFMKDTSNMTNLPEGYAQMSEQERLTWMEERKQQMLHPIQIKLPQSVEQLQRQVSLARSRILAQLKKSQTQCPNYQQALPKDSFIRLFLESIPQKTIEEEKKLCE